MHVARRPMVAGPEGDRRWTAVLSLDMVGFTELSNRIGPERAFSLIERVLGLAREAVADHGGFVVDTAGDGMLASFGAPLALEKASLEACRAALAFRAALAEATDDLKAEFGSAVAFRVGLAGGNTMVARREADAMRLVGSPVNQAARIQALAAPGEILISGAIRNETEGYLATEPRGAVELKGFEGAVELHAVMGLERTVTTFDGARRRGLVEMVSRERDLASAVETLKPGRPGRTVVVSGAPGIGKSRLAHEIAETLKPERSVHFGQCAPGSTDYAPVLDLLRDAAGAPPGSTRSDILAALNARHPGLANAETARAFTGSSARTRDPSERAMRERDFLGDLLYRLQDRTNAVFIIEDAHWIDTATDGLVQALSRTDLALVITARPEYARNWTARRGVTNIDLVPLADEAIRRLTEAGLSRPVTDALADLITGKSEGNPLMAEEIARTLRQGGRLVEQGGRIGLALGDSGSLLSGNLEQLVLSRVDRLAPARKAALQTASVIGRDFSEGLLARVLGVDPDTAGIAERPGLIEDRGEGRWRFSHALVRDAVYNSLLSAQREAAHRAVGEAIEAGPGPGAETYASLALHFEAAGDLDRAVPYLIRAAEQHLGAYALADVDRDLTRVAAALDDHPDLLDDADYRRFVLTWLRALDQLGDFGKLRRVGGRLLPRLAAMGYSPTLGIARTFTAIAMAHVRDYTAAETLAELTRREATLKGDEWGAAWAKIALMRIYDETDWKDRDLIERMAAEIEPVAQQTEDRHLEMNALYLLSSSFRSSGQRLRALETAERLDALFAKHEDRRARGFSLWARALIYSVDGNPEMAHALGRDARQAAIPGSA
ncbi:MAG: AAA family ATPase, partial [Pseudomonadota bacterium]